MNDVLAIASVLLISVTWTLDTSSFGAARDPGPGLLLDGSVLTIRGGPLLAAAPGLDPLALTLSVNGRSPVPAFSLSHPEGDTTRLRVLFPHGAANADDATLYHQGQPHELLVTTQPDHLPMPRYWAAHVSDGRFVYLLGGVTFHDHQSRYSQDTPLDTVLRVDLETGDMRTMVARLPVPAGHAAAAWDPRPTAECPGGCAYVFGGRDADGTWLASILRYDPAGDRVTMLPAQLPDGLVDPLAVWTGSDVLVFAGGHFGIHRFDPQAGTLETLAHSGLTGVWGSAAVFDATATAACPRGCAYMLGGQDARFRGATMFPNGPHGPFNRATIVRVDASTGQAVLLDALLPEPRSGHAAVWDGKTAYVVGGISCDDAKCWAPEEVVRFDPSSGLVEEAALRLPQRPLYTSALERDGMLVLIGGLSTSDVVLTNPLDSFSKIDPAVALERVVRVALA